MRAEFVVVTDERGVEIFFIDWRDAHGCLADSRFFQAERDAREYLAMGGGR